MWNIIKKPGSLKKIYKILIAYIKMEKVIKFNDIGSQRQTFNQHARPILIKTMDINKILVSNKVSFGKKNI